MPPRKLSLVLLLAVQLGQAQVFFNAERSDSEREQVHVFQGDAIAINESLIIAADVIRFDQKKELLYARDNLVILGNDQVYLGDSLVYSPQKKHLSLSKAQLIHGDAGTYQKYFQKIMGFTAGEHAFQAKRQQRLAELAAHKAELRHSYSKQPSSATIEKYVVLLERESLISRQEYPVLNKNKRHLYRQRRDFWREHRANTAALSGFSYFSLKSGRLDLVGNESFEAEEVLFSPCFCAPGERRPWAVQAKRLDGRSGGYADFYQPIILIKGVPVFYLPYMKVPLKNQRQSGFLSPTLSFSARQGSTLKQPIFFAWDSDKDSTLDVVYFEKRGLKLGLEYRQQVSRDSRWEFSGEIIRDREWVQQHKRRQDLAKKLGEDFELARKFGGNVPENLRGSAADPSWWHGQGLGRCLEDEFAPYCKQYEIDGRLSSPEQAWRSRFSWRGQSFLLPRLSVVGSGLWQRDHRHEYDLQVNDFADFTDLPSPEVFAANNLGLHFDHSLFYLGLGSSFADPLLASQRFAGYQLPLYLKLQSPLFSLSQFGWLPVYAQASYKGQFIDRLRKYELNELLGRDQAFQALGSGNVHQVSLRLNGPIIIPKSIFVIDYFVDFNLLNAILSKGEIYSQVLSPPAAAELRPLSAGTAYHHYMRTGLTFRLPMDGRWWLRGKEESIEHRMNWQASLAWKPYITQQGEYGKHFSELTYSDIWRENPNSSVLVYRRSHLPGGLERSITLSTQHQWLLHKEPWQRQEADSQPESTEESLRERARRELTYGIEKQFTDHKEIMSGDKWVVPHYQRKHIGQQQVLSLESSINYDQARAEARQEQLANNPEKKVLGLAESWSQLKSEARADWSRWHLIFSSEYNFYKNLVTEANVNLGLPPLGFLNLGFSYGRKQEVYLDKFGEFAGRPSSEWHYNLSTGYFSNFNLEFQYGYKITKNLQGTAGRRSVSNITYNSPSRCWGWVLAWKKEFGEVLWKGSYYFGLVVKFGPAEHNYGNFLKKLNQRG